jgi:large subunit ribosomal protein L5
MQSRLKDRYNNEIIPALMEKFSYDNVMQVPTLEKVVINIGVGEAKDNPKILEASVRELAEITGQQPVVTRAKKSISNFKLREGMKVGCKVTLRGQKMYDFFDKLVTIALPRVRDFKGVSASSFDGRGNYSMGIKEQLIFPEIDYDKIEKVQGMDIIIVTSANTDEESREFLRMMGMPFKK